MPSVTVVLELKPVPLIVKGWAELEPVTGFGLTDEMVGVTFGAFTWKLYFWEESDPLLTCTHQVAAVVPKFGLMTI